MAQIRKYFTYIPNLVVSTEYPGGAYVTPHKFFEIHFGPTETLHHSDMFSRPVDGQDCRVLAWVEGDDAHLANGSTLTVTEFAIVEGLKTFGAAVLSDNDALGLAQIFSPGRPIPAGPGNSEPMVIQDCEFDQTGKIVQLIVPAV